MGADIFLAAVARDVLYCMNMPQNLLSLLDSCHDVQILDMTLYHEFYFHLCKMTE